MQESFYTTIYNIYQQSFPLVRLSRKRARDKIWITNEIKTRMKERDKLYRKKLKSPTKHNIDTFNNCKNEISTRLKDAEINYYRQKLDDRRTATNNFWKCFSKTLNPNKTKSKTQISKLLIEEKGKKIEENTAPEICDHMNKHFCNIGKKN